MKAFHVFGFFCGISVSALMSAPGKSQLIERPEESSNSAQSAHGGSDYLIAELAKAFTDEALYDWPRTSDWYAKQKEAVWHIDRLIQYGAPLAQALALAFPKGVDRAPLEAVFIRHADQLSAATLNAIIPLYAHEIYARVKEARCMACAYTGESCEKYLHSITPNAWLGYVLLRATEKRDSTKILCLTEHGADPAYEFTAQCLKGETAHALIPPSYHLSYDLWWPRTALHTSAYSGDKVAVKVFIDTLRKIKELAKVKRRLSQPDPNDGDLQSCDPCCAGKTARDLAKMRGHKDATALLLRAERIS